MQYQQGRFKKLPPCFSENVNMPTHLPKCSFSYRNSLLIACKTVTYEVIREGSILYIHD